MTTSRDEIIARVQKLRKMTEANGATEAEALTAIRLIARLMAEHSLTETETQLRADSHGCLEDFFVLMQATYDEWRVLPRSIGRLHACVAYFHRQKEDLLGLGIMVDSVAVRFYGFPQDATAAAATMAICATAVNMESRAIKAQGKKFSFRLGMVERLAERIEQIIEERVAAAALAPKGQSLVVLKEQLVHEEWNKRGIKLYASPRPGKHRFDSAAHSAGRDAANRVDLGAGPRLRPSTGPLRLKAGS